MIPMRKIEICCTSVADVQEAFYGGAIRVELCSAISCGGVTPSCSLISEAVKTSMSLAEEQGGSDRIRVNVLIRPREGNFCYNASEVRTMLSDIVNCREMGVDGVVIGALTSDGDIDMDICERLVEAAEGMSVTFHRAFDLCRNPQQALEQIISLGCDRLLTSGQKPKALDGSELISRLVRQAGGRIIVMPGSGINPHNIAEIERITGAEEFHSTARGAVPDVSGRIVPELGFDEPAVILPLDPDAEKADSESGQCRKRYVLRTTRNVVKLLV